MQTKKVVSIIAASLIFFGFGMIHGKTRIVEASGSIMIGLGSFYFIIILVLKHFQNKKNQ
jgi:hypothetical protein